MSVSAKKYLTAQAHAASPLLAAIAASRVEKVEQRVCTLTFEAFVKCIHPQWNPLPWFHQKMCDEIQAWWDAPRAYNLIFVMPPGHGKSYFAKLAVAWIYAMNPDEQAAYTSYGQDLASDHCGEIQELMLSPTYEKVAPSVRLNKRRAVSDEKRGARRTKDRFDVVRRRGKFRAVGFGGPLTGQRVNVGVIDDPLKNSEDAASPTRRAKQWAWYTRVMRTRASPGIPQRLIMVLTRWHLDDLAGRVLARQPGSWRLVHFAALKVGPPTADDPREPGEALWPEAFPRERLEEERELDPEGFSALFQGTPVAEGGNVFKEAWIAKRWRALPDTAGTWVQSWDLRGGGEGKKTSWAVGGLWYRPHGQALCYLVDVVRGRWTTDETLDVIRRINVANVDARLHPPTEPGEAVAGRQTLWAKAGVKLVEKKADGVAVLSQLASVVPGLRAVMPSADKLTRAKAVTPFFAAGNVLLPQGALWLASYEGELLTFPVAESDDQVDMTSMALDHIFGATTTERTAADRAKDASILFS